MACTIFLRPLLSIGAAALMLSSCGGGGSISTPTPPPPPQMTLSLGGTSSVDMQQDGNLNTTLVLTVANAPGAVTITVTGLPAGISAQYDATSQSLMFSGGPNVSAGTYLVTVTATSGTQSASQLLTVVNDVVAVVNPAVDTTLGVNGKLEQFMSTSFQIGSWTTDYFGTGPGAPRTVVVETSGLGTAAGAFSKATLLTIDATTNTTTGPTAAAIAPYWRQPITLHGYGVAFLTLTP
jgi:hypothetical protein